MRRLIEKGVRRFPGWAPAANVGVFDDAAWAELVCGRPDEMPAVSRRLDEAGVEHELISWLWRPRRFPSVTDPTAVVTIRVRRDELAHARATVAGIPVLGFSWVPGTGWDRPVRHDRGRTERA